MWEAEDRQPSRLLIGQCHSLPALSSEMESLLSVPKETTRLLSHCSRVFFSSSCQRSICRLSHSQHTARRNALQSRIFLIQSTTASWKLSKHRTSSYWKIPSHTMFPFCNTTRYHGSAELVASRLQDYLFSDSGAFCNTNLPTCGWL